MISLSKKNWLACLGVLAMGGASLAGNPGTEKVRERFLREAPSGWAILDEWDRDLELEGYSIPDPGQPELRRLFRYVRKGEDRLAQDSGALAGEPSRSTSGVFVLGREYGFWLQRKSPSSPWALISLYKDKQKTDLLHEIQMRYLNFTNPHNHLGATPLADLDQKEGFSWTDFRLVRREGKELVEAQYRAANRYPRVPEPVPVVGYLVLDPANHWAIMERSASLIEKPPQTQVAQRSGIRVTYAGTNLGRVRPFTQVEDFHSFDGKNEQKSFFQVTQVRRATADDSAFTLSGYGLPEIVDRPSKTKWSLWLWLALGGVICLGLGFAIRRHWLRAG